MTEALNIYRLRLADAGAARVRFLEVAGPIRPVPAPSRKPRRAAGATQEAPVVAGAPLPRLKPVLETSLTPSAALSVAPTPAEPPEARRPSPVIRLAQAGHDEAEPSGQAMTAPG